MEAIPSDLNPKSQPWQHATRPQPSQFGVVKKEQVRVKAKRAVFPSATSQQLIATFGSKNCPPGRGISGLPRSAKREPVAKLVDEEASSTALVDEEASCTALVDVKATSTTLVDEETSSTTLLDKVSKAITGTTEKTEEEVEAAPLLKQEGPEEDYVVLEKPLEPDTGLFQFSHRKSRSVLFALLDWLFPTESMIVVTTSSNATPGTPFCCVDCSSKKWEAAKPCGVMYNGMVLEAKVVFL
jgi:hypothetical protein